MKCQIHNQAYIFLLIRTAKGNEELEYHVGINITNKAAEVIEIGI